MLPVDVGAHVYTAVIGRRLFYYPVVDSTNDTAVAMARDGEPEGTVVYADFQRRGRGRSDHTWSSRSGADLLFSVVLRPPGRPHEALPVSLVAALALSVTLSKRLGNQSDVGVKWPNDLMCAGGKLAGILAESGADERDGRYVVVGVGINVNGRPDDYPEEIRDRVVSCHSQTGVEFDRAALFGDVLTALDGYYGRFRADGFAPLRSAYEERLVQAGRRVSFEREGARIEARVLGVNDDGALRVRTSDGGELVLYDGTMEDVE